MLHEFYPLDNAYKEFNAVNPLDFPNKKAIYALAEKGKIQLSIKVIKGSWLTEYGKAEIDKISINPRSEDYQEALEKIETLKSKCTVEIDGEQILDIVGYNKNSVEVWPVSANYQGELLSIPADNTHTSGEYKKTRVEVLYGDNDRAIIGITAVELKRLLGQSEAIIDVSIDKPLNQQEFESNLKENGFAYCRKEIYLTQGCAAYWICESLGLLSDPHDEPERDDEPKRDEPEQVEYERLDRLESFVKEGAIRLYNRNAREQMQEREYDADALFLMSDLRKLVADKYPGQKLRGDDHFVVSAPLRYIEIIKQASIEPGTTKQTEAKQESKEVVKTVPRRGVPETQEKRILEELNERGLTVDDLMPDGFITELKEIIKVASSPEIKPETTRKLLAKMGVCSVRNTRN